MEEKIAQSLKQNIPQPAVDSPTVHPVVSDPSAIGPDNFELDEITLYKLHQHFGEEYKESDSKANQQYQFIYAEIAERLGNNDYPFVVARINDLKRMLGLNHTSNPRYKLYQWLKLDQRRSRIEMEQNNIRESL